MSSHNSNSYGICNSKTTVPAVVVSFDRSHDDFNSKVYNSHQYCGVCYYGEDEFSSTEQLLIGRQWCFHVNECVI